MKLYCATSNPGKLREFQLAAGSGRLPAPRFDQRRATAAERVPAPAEVGHAGGVGPVHEALHERRAALPLTELRYALSVAFR